MAGLVVRRHPDAQAFLARAQGYLVEREAENVLMLGVAFGATEAEHALTVDRGEDCVMAAFQAGENLVLSRGPTGAVAALVEQLSVDDSLPSGVIGPARTTGSFLESWHARTGHETRFQMHSRVHELTQVIPPRRPTGVFRRAVLSDVEPLASWADALNIELRSEDPPPGEQTVRKRIGLGRMFVWDHGGPVSMAACDGPTPRGMRINFVYTPPEHRARGYASACVADLSQLLLDEGRRFCALFTDLANPVSNRLYARLGYRPICDFDEYVFVP